MHDLDKIKRYQLEFLQKYPIEDNKDLIKAILFHECASWFYIYVRQGLKVLPEQELRHLITETLALESFKLCRAYYLERPADKRPEVELIRRADVDEYVAAAKAYKEKKSIKKSLLSVLKKIYTSI